MKHHGGIDLVRAGADVGYTVGEGSLRGRSGSGEYLYRIEVWSDESESGGELLETISRASDFSVSCAALKAAVRARPGKVLMHLNARHRMSAERAPDPPVPEWQRPLRVWGRPLKRRWIGCWNGTSWSAPVRSVVVAGL